jgi:hypothetical protein
MIIHLLSLEQPAPRIHVVPLELLQLAELQREKDSTGVTITRFFG